MEAIEQLYPRVVVAGIAAAAGITDPKKIREFEPRLVRWAEVTLRILEDNELDSERTPVRLRRLAKKAEELDAELTELIDDMEAEALLWAAAQEHGPQEEGEPPPSSESFDLGAYRVGNVQDNVRDLITWARDRTGRLATVQDRRAAP